MHKIVCKISISHPKNSKDDEDHPRPPRVVYVTIRSGREAGQVFSIFSELKLIFLLIVYLYIMSSMYRDVNEVDVKSLAESNLVWLFNTAADNILVPVHQIVKGDDKSREQDCKKIYLNPRRKVSRDDLQMGTIVMSNETMIPLLVMYDL